MSEDKIPLEYLVETLAKALCFEKYVAVNNIDDYDQVNSKEAIAYYHERSELYLHKSFELLSMFHDFEEDEIPNTFH
jgi:hypothetical protein|tara:strand:+ start:395 stop:625 length:231 start_codon:yes stop_codon:yes gene_type:complete